MTDQEQQLDTLLDRARLSVDQDEREHLLRIFPVIRESIAALRPAETRYAEPAMVFRP
jgi:hypothetical protein